MTTPNPPTVEHADDGEQVSPREMSGHAKPAIAAFPVQTPPSQPNIRGITHTSMSILRGTYQWLELPALTGNHIKRLSTKPKGYLADTGLASYLMRLSSPEAVQGHPAFGALFETLVVTECHKQV